MRFNFTGKNMVVSDSLKEKAEKKINRIARLFPENVEINVTFSVVKTDNTIEVTIPLNKRILRSETTAADMQAALDQTVDILERQMVKYKTRLKGKSRRDASFKDELNFVPATVADEPDDVPEMLIEKTKRFALEPMEADEAVMEMEMLGHSFYVFRNIDTGETNVVYKRKNGSYGLIEPEF